MKAKSILGFVIGMVAAVLFFMLFSVISYYMGFNEGQEQYSDLAKMVQDAKTGSDELVDAVSADTGETIQVFPEYKALYEINDDLIGWIQVEGADIAFPVVYKPIRNPDNTFYYDTRNFYRENSKQGAIFAHEFCEPETSDNMTIFGHGMQSGTMFAKLLNYKEEGFFLAHPYLQFDSLNERRTYAIVAVFSSTSASGFAYQDFIDAADQAAFDDYITQCKKLDLYDTGITAEYGEKLITLSVSDGDDRFVIVAKLLAE